MSTNQDSNSKQTLIFSYGTLKRGFSNHYLMRELINKNVAVFLGPYITHHPYPLVCGPYDIPYLIHLSGSGNRVKGELYSVSTQGLARLDEFEGTKFGHYDRLPVQVQSEEDEGEGLVEAEAYFANKSFAERLWEKKGKVGWNEYSESDGKQYVKPGDRAKDSCILDDIELFLSSIQ
ncbi:putative gamma-glutamylcyclotransferase At3g02910 [Pistacia vera]|uniref:putative gamma-glutamylcyclotransferase At3g02910 n=1 Tax=Pistacia vera TaxID=55513 RepID=UPI0012636769|nr:putative gamma-glutamylcyclotransferase At3g02910 [Pistacia vera]